MTAYDEFDDDWVDPHAVEVRHVQPYQADKAYTCPHCHGEIPTGQGHKVVVPLAAPEDRRHWHTGCWERAARTQPR
jgi:hypothetical protein